jgi:hypothetical protein
MHARTWICLLLLTAANAMAAGGNELALVGTEENDVFSVPWRPHTDRHYTQGLKISLLAGDQQFANTTGFFNQLLTAVGFQPARLNLGFVLLAQHIYTPGSIYQPDPILDDRPYAGWLYSGLIFQRTGLTAGGVPTFENWELDLGIVGPESLANVAQTEVHRVRFPDDIPQGWHYQLPFEPGLELKYDRRWRLSLVNEESRWFDLIPHVGGSVGNIRVHANAGLLARLGWNLPDDYGPALMESTLSPVAPPPKRPPFGCFVFAGIEGRALARDLFLDGSTFRSSLKVEKRPFVGDLQVGFGVVAFQYLEFTYTYVRRSEQFVHQEDADEFASLNARLNCVF